MRGGDGGGVGRRRLGRIFRPAPGVEVDDELAFHVEAREREYIARGMAPEAARSAALERMGDLAEIREACTELLVEDRRAAARQDRLSELRQDVRFGVRSAIRAPLFSLMAVATLALGIGANAAVFGVVKSVLLDGLPYEEADGLVRVHTIFDPAPTERSSISPGLAADVAERQRSFARLAAFGATTFDVTHHADGGPRVLTAAQVTGDFFRTLGVRAEHGRLLTDDDGRDGAAPVVVLSHEAWLRELGGDPGAVGETLRIDGDPYAVAGVLPPGFVGPMGAADVWFAFDLAVAARDGEGAREQHWLGLVGRLRAGVALEAAGRDLASIAADMTRSHPDTDTGRTLAAVALRDDMVGDTRTPLLVLMASAALVLLITCANLAGAQLSRTLTRRKEFAVRAALGAGRGRLVRQLLTESTLTAVVGGSVGLLLAWAGLRAVRGVAATALPAYADLSLDAGAVLVTAALALATGIAFGVVPALSAGRIRGTLREESRGASEGRRSQRLRGLLVAGQIALSVSLLVGAGLLVRTLWAITSAPRGFEPAGVLTLAVRLPANTYGTDASRSRLFDGLEERISGLPGVTGVASVTQLPRPDMTRNLLLIDGRGMEDEAPTFIPYAAVSDGYFRTMGVRLVSGRGFGPEDHADAPPAIVISESLARRYWPGGDAIGARIQISPLTVDPKAVVVGIVADVRLHPTESQLQPMAYASVRQDATRGTRSYVVRAGGDLLGLVPAIQRELSAIDPALPVREPATLEHLLARSLAGRRLPVLLMSAFGALALLLASVGVYAMFAAMAAAREREFGIRIALGSTPRSVAAMVLRQGGAWMMAGLVAGSIGVLGVARMLRGLLVGVAPFDPVALGVALATIVLCATIALLVPVRRAARVDPITALR